MTTAEAERRKVDVAPLPKVSVLITCYNYAGYVRQAVDSALAQDYGGPLEVLVGDDGSTDGSGEVLAPYGDRIRYLHQENRGQAAAFNLAYANASGDIICLLDADDEWYPAKVRRVVETFGEAPEAGLIHHDMGFVDAEGQPLKGLNVFSWELGDGDLRAVMRKAPLEWRFVPTSGIALTRPVCDRVFPLREGLKSSADELIAPVAALLSPVRHLREPLGSYRVHGANVWATHALQPDHGPGAKRKAAERFVRLLDEKVAQANRVLSDDGGEEMISPWVNWKYIRARAACEEHRPIYYWPRAARAIMTSRHFSSGEKLSRTLLVTRKVVKYLGRARL